MGAPGTGALALFQKKKNTLGQSGTRALGQMLVSKKQPWALGHSGTCSFPKKKKNTLGQLATRDGTASLTKQGGGLVVGREPFFLMWFPSYLLLGLLLNSKLVKHKKHIK